ncbi:AbrB family transcriptional regulator [Pseudogemmobacter faecipullorum]|uniref:AbrB family transcriptional regulator n=1 Tax=Pseudogemmobacter faecipullorum TaxID=2755041 RepID=A0ABS8CII2_9RHOB|nr:AbrB family transcriptional regulator [Pseudogemmobacter faecipullorum]MCB5409186.1 AbrB family transcriptional regulator [Pseudogemmobacter faecipullorum]
MTLFRRYILGLSLGTAGGLLFWQLGLPLPWMLGALSATMIASVCGLPLAGPDRFRPWVVAVIGVMLGARFSPEVMAQALSWLGSLGLLTLCLIAMGLVNVPFYRFIGGYDWRTSYFAGMPGGLAEMIELAEAKGGKVQPVILSHSLRIVVTIALIAVWFRLILGHSVGSGAGFSVALSWSEAGLLLAAAVFGSLIGRALRWPAPTFLGPMALSAVLHLSGISESAPPGILVNAAQIVLGTVLGCRFRGVPLAALRHAALLSLGSTALILGLALGFSWAMQALLGIDMMQALLALAPGGLTEMGLIALAIEADVAFVALHHVVRILIVLVAAPLVFTLFDRRLGKSHPGSDPGSGPG